MGRDTTHKNLFLSALWGVLFLFTLSCGSDAEYTGLYKTREGESKKQSAIELKAGGEGYWRVEDSEESFTWYVKGDQIRLNTKQGGVIVAKIEDNTLKIVLTGGKKMTFIKVE
jgi:hypothetical protein